MTYSMYYKLVGHEAVPCSEKEGIRQWGEDRRVALTNLDNGVVVSTVFLPLNHAFREDDGPPMIFETMVFGKDDTLDSLRASTWEQAQEKHNNMVDKWKDYKNEDR